MRAVELRVGDWVLLKGQPHRVSYIVPFDFGDALLAAIDQVLDYLTKK